MNGIWFIKVFDGVRHTWPDRRIEWLMGIWALVWAGKWLLDPADNFNTASNAWAGLRFLYGSEVFFASGMCICGLLRLLALTVNGTFRGTVYARYSPVVRAITAGACGIAWLSVWLSSSAQPQTQGIVTFWGFVLVEFFLAFKIVDESADVIRIGDMTDTATAPDVWSGIAGLPPILQGVAVLGVAVGLGLFLGRRYLKRLLTEPSSTDFAVGEPTMFADMTSVKVLVANTEKLTAQLITNAALEVQLIEAITATAKSLGQIVDTVGQLLIDMREEREEREGHERELAAEERGFQAGLLSHRRVPAKPRAPAKRKAGS